MRVVQVKIKRKRKEVYKYIRKVQISTILTYQKVHEHYHWTRSELYCIILLSYPLGYYYQHPPFPSNLSSFLSSFPPCLWKLSPTLPFLSSQSFTRYFFFSICNLYNENEIKISFFIYFLATLILLQFLQHIKNVISLCQKFCNKYFFLNDKFFS